MTETVPQRLLHGTEDSLSFQTKCGEIFLSDDSLNYLFVCTFCNETFMNLGFFIDHLQENHIKNDERATHEELVVEELLKVEVKTEHVASEPDISFDPLENKEFNDSDEFPLSSLGTGTKNTRSASKSRKRNAEIKSGESNTLATPKHTVVPNPSDADMIKPMKTRKTNAARKIKPFKCDECTRSYFKEEDLVKHKTSHSRRPFKCELCGLGFQSMANLKIHMRRHNGEKPFKCETCGKAFTTAYELRVHSRIHNDEKPFVCEICGKGFRVIAALTDHRKAHLDIRDHKCSQCDKAYRNSWLLLEHVKSHSTRPLDYECEICHRKFGKAKTLYQHKKIHAEVKCYVCKICKKAYAQSSGLHAHMKSHSEIKEKDKGKKLKRPAEPRVFVVGRESSQSHSTSNMIEEECPEKAKILQTQNVQFTVTNLQFVDNVQH